MDTVNFAKAILGEKTTSILFCYLEISDLVMRVF